MCLGLGRMLTVEHDTWMPEWFEQIVRVVAGVLKHSSLYGAGWILLYKFYETRWPGFLVIGAGLLFIGIITEFTPVRKMMEAEKR